MLTPPLNIVTALLPPAQPAAPKATNSNSPVEFFDLILVALAGVPAIVPPVVNAIELPAAIGDQTEATVAESPNSTGLAQVSGGGSRESTGPSAKKFTVSARVENVATPTTQIPSQVIPLPTVPAALFGSPATVGEANSKPNFVLAGQLADIILDHVPAAMASGPVTVRLRFDSPDAGSIDLRLSATATHVSAILTVVSDETRAKVARMLPELMARLNEAGIVSDDASALSNEGPGLARQLRSARRRHVDVDA